MDGNLFGGGVDESDVDVLLLSHSVVEEELQAVVDAVVGPAAIVLLRRMVVG